jgi:hypothetical protein
VIFSICEKPPVSGERILQQAAAKFVSKPSVVIYFRGKDRRDPSVRWSGRPPGGRAARPATPANEAC